MVSQEQINTWKQKHEVLEVPFSDGRTIYLAKPDRRVLGLAYMKGAKDPLGVSDVILVNCWLGGDESVKTDVGCLVAVQDLVDQLAEKVAVEFVPDPAKPDLHMFSFEDNTICFLKQPNREQTSLAMLASRKDPFAMVESFLNTCWVDGDEVIKTSVGHLVALIAEVDKIIGVKTAMVKKI